MKCKLCKGDVKVSKTVARDHVIGLCLNPQCKRYMVKTYVKAEEIEKNP